MVVPILKYRKYFKYDFFAEVSVADPKPMTLFIHTWGLVSLATSVYSPPPTLTVLTQLTRSSSTWPCKGFPGIPSEEKSEEKLWWAGSCHHDALVTESLCCSVRWYAQCYIPWRQRTVLGDTVIWGYVIATRSVNLSGSKNAVLWTKCAIIVKSVFSTVLIVHNM